MKMDVILKGIGRLLLGTLATNLFGKEHNYIDYIFKGLHGLNTFSQLPLNLEIHL